MTRREARALRSALPPASREEWSRRIQRHVLSWETFQRAQSVMAYVSVGAEVETHALLPAILAAGKRLLLPRCHEHGMMVAVEIADLSALVPGVWDIPEPPRAWPAAPKEAIDLILVPGLLFDPAGGRLGQGGGYYDRFLAAYAGDTCGLAFADQVVPHLDTKPHDMPVGALITQEGLCNCRGGMGLGET